MCVFVCVKRVAEHLRHDADWHVRPSSTHQLVAAPTSRARVCTKPREILYPNITTKVKNSLSCSPKNPCTVRVLVCLSLCFSLSVAISLVCRRRLCQRVPPPPPPPPTLLLIQVLPHLPVAGIAQYISRVCVCYTLRTRSLFTQARARESNAKFNTLTHERRKTRKKTSHVCVTNGTTHSFMHIPTNRHVFAYYIIKVCLCHQVAVQQQQRLGTLQS